MPKEITKKETKSEDNKQVTLKLNVNMIVVGLLTVLVFVSVVQTISLANLIGKKTTTQTQSASSTNQGQAGKSNLPVSLQNVPQQVGGC